MEGRRLRRWKIRFQRPSDAKNTKKYKIAPCRVFIIFIYLMINYNPCNII